MTSNNLPPKPLLNSALIMTPISFIEIVSICKIINKQHTFFNSTHFINGFQFILAIKKFQITLYSSTHEYVNFFPKMRLTSHKNRNSDASGDVLCQKTAVFKYLEILHLFL